MNIPQNLPTLCDICMSVEKLSVIPDRTPGEWRFVMLCPLCWDQFVDLFPIRVSAIFDREIYTETF